MRLLLVPLALQDSSEESHFCTALVVWYRLRTGTWRELTNLHRLALSYVAVYLQDLHFQMSVTHYMWLLIVLFCEHSVLSACVCLSVYHMHEGTHGNQKKVLNSLDLQLQMDVTTTLVLRLTPRTSAITNCALNYRDISPACLR